MTDNGTMDPDRWEQVQNIFHAALRRDSDQWDAFLDQACFEDHELRSEVASLLEGHAHGTAVGWFEDVPATRPLERMGQYRIVKLLGEGGMGSVYLAEREGTDFKQKVALKLMRADFQSSAVEDRLRSERRILAGLEHPGIARLIDGGTTPTGQPYYAMEYVEGSNVVDYSDERRLSIAKRLELFLRICEPVLYAHQQLVVHRDIKPNNILVTHDGLPKLLDFGIAKALDPDRDLQRMTRTGAWFTPAYAAPEQIRGDQVSTLSDVYALGILLYELLTGRLPYRIGIGSPEEILRIVCELMPDRPSTVVRRPIAYESADGAAGLHGPEFTSAARNTTPSRLRHQLSGDLDTIVLKALAKEPSERYASVEQFAADIRRHLDGQPVLARPDSVRYRAARFVARHRASLGVATVIAIIILAYVSTVTMQNAQIRRALDQARIETDRSSQLTELLLGLFESAGTGGDAPGSFTAARELLARGHARARGMEGRPAAQAQMLAALSRVHRHLGEYDEAAPELEQALALHRQLYGDRHLTVAEDLVDLAEVYRLMGRYDEAEDAAREALETERELIGGEHPRVARTLNELSLVLRDAGDYVAAEPSAREALAMRQRLLGGDHPDVAESLNYLAALLRRMGDYDAAEPLYRQALEMRRQIYGGDHPLLAESINNLALQLFQRGNTEGAEPLYREALGMYHRLFGRDHPFVATTTTNLATVLTQAGTFDEAEQLYREALSVRRRAYGEEHPEIAASLDAIGSLMYQRGALEDALEYHRTALVMRRKLLGAEHPNEVLNLRNLSLVLRAQGDLGAAEPFAREAVRVGRKVLGGDHPNTAAALSELAGVSTAKGDYPAAERLLLEALEIRRRLLGDDNRIVATAAGELVTLYDAWGRPDAADPYRALAAR